jgi:hypothetical protein
VGQGHFVARLEDHPFRLERTIVYETATAAPREGYLAHRCSARFLEAVPEHAHVNRQSLDAIKVE